MDWITSNAAYSPELEHCTEIKRAFAIFEASLLSDSTSVHLYETAAEPSGNLETTVLTAPELSSVLQQIRTTRGSSFFFINKYLVKDRKARIPHDSNKLRISKKALQDLTLHLNIPPSFVFALSRYYLPTGRGTSEHTDSTGRAFINIWYILPVRVQVPCNSSHNDEELDKEGSDQMNPFNYLHLPHAEVDIRGSFIAVTFRLEKETGFCSCVVLNMMHGGWPKAVEEPQRRILETIQRSQRSQTARTPYFVHLIYLTSASRWWTNALHSVNEQLIAYEAQLQEDMDSEQKPSENENNSSADTSDATQKLNRALHSIDAHLHRFRSELSTMEGITRDLVEQYASICDETIAAKASQDFSQVLSQIQATSGFAKELGKKIQNILALLFSRIQTSSDQLLVENGRAMHQILQTTQNEVDEQRKLAEEMKKDSVAMKTIAVVTMFFLPGASFAALLSMPFLSENEWLKQTSRLWIWLVLTVPSTLLAFAFYMYSRKREERRRSIAQV